MTDTQDRRIQRIIPAIATSDGAGVKIKRSLGQTAGARLDPILLLDEFNSEDAADYIAGFPDHPHRGFTTITYMLDGHMLHRDHMGNKGDLHPGDVQWMSAGRGIIHSEMPQQYEGRMRGFQLWVNLPAAEKMKPAAYRDIKAREIPSVTLANGGQGKIIAGDFLTNQGKTSGPIQGLSTEPVYWDLHLMKGSCERFRVPRHHQLFLYPYEGQVKVGKEQRILEQSQAGILSPGEYLSIQAIGKAKLLLIGGKAIGEPVAQYGPFVMNSQEEIEQAIADYRNGQLTTP